LDARSNRIKNELAEAQKLRSEAEALLASFEQKRKDAEAEAAAIVAQAKSEAEMIAVEARKRLEEFVARGDKQIRTRSGRPRLRPLPKCVRRPPIPRPGWRKPCCAAALLAARISWPTGSANCGRLRTEN